MVKLSEVIRHLQEYQDEFGDMPVFINSTTMPDDVAIMPLRSTNVVQVNNNDEVDKQSDNAVQINIVVLSDQIISPEGYSIHDKEEQDE